MGRQPLPPRSYAPRAYSFIDVLVESLGKLGLAPIELDHPFNTRQTLESLIQGLFGNALGQPFFMNTFEPNPKGGF